MLVHILSHHIRIFTRLSSCTSSPLRNVCAWSNLSSTNCPNLSRQFHNFNYQQPRKLKSKPYKLIILTFCNHNMYSLFPNIFLLVFVTIFIQYLPVVKYYWKSTIALLLNIFFPQSKKAALAAAKVKYEDRTEAWLPEWMNESKLVTEWIYQRVLECIRDSRLRWSQERAKILITKLILIIIINPATLVILTACITQERELEKESARRGTETILISPETTTL